MNIYLVAHQYAGCEEIAFSTLEKALEYIKQDDTAYVIEIELDAPFNPFYMTFDPHQAIVYRA